MKAGEKLTRERLKAVAEISELKAGESILDIGCGSMEFKRYLTPYLPKGVKYIGIDQDKEADIVWNLEKGLPNLKGKFDVILISATLEQIENFKTLLKDAVSVLKDDGRMVIATPCPYRFLRSEYPAHIHSFRKTNIKNLCDMLGLRIDKITGDAIHIPILDIVLRTRNSCYSNFFIYRLKKAL